MATNIFTGGQNNSEKYISNSKFAREERLTAYLFILPICLGLVLFFVGPMISSLYLSFTRYDVLRPSHFIGLKNYMDLFKDELFWTSLSNTAFMTLVGVPINILIAILLALLLNHRDMAGIAVYRTLFYMPAITPTVAAAVLWYWILNSQWGVLNQVLGLLGIHGPLWLGDPLWSKPSIILMNMINVGPTMLIFLAGLQGIPTQLYESAKIDGASKWKMTFSITLPLLTPTIFFNVVMGMIGTLQMFTEAYVLTQGGPLNSTLFYVYYLFNNGFAFFKMGYASAMAWILFVIIFLVTRLQFYLSKLWVFYET